MKKILYGLLICSFTIASCEPENDLPLNGMVTGTIIGVDSSIHNRHILVVTDSLRKNHTGDTALIKLEDKFLPILYTAIVQNNGRLQGIECRFETLIGYGRNISPQRPKLIFVKVNNNLHFETK